MCFSTLSLRSRIKKSEASYHLITACNEIIVLGRLQTGENDRNSQTHRRLLEAGLGLIFTLDIFTAHHLANKRGRPQYWENCLRRTFDGMQLDARIDAIGCHGVDTRRTFSTFGRGIHRFCVSAIS